MSEKTLEQLKAEAEQAQVALRDAEVSAKRAAQEAERVKLAEQAKLERAEHIARFMKHAEAIVEALRALNVDATIEPPHDAYRDYPVIVIAMHGQWNRYCVQFDHSYTGSTWSRTSKRSYRVRVNIGGDAKSYPMRKDETFNYAGIAKDVAERIETMRQIAEAFAEKEATIASAEAFAGEVKRALGVPEDGALIAGVIRSSSYDGRGRHCVHASIARAGHVFVKVGTLELTPEAARVIYEALTAVRSMKSEEQQS